MSHSVLDRTTLPATLPVATWVLAAALLAAEYLLAVFLFDAERLPVAGDTEVFRNLGESMPLIIVVMTATLVIRGTPHDGHRAQIARAFRRRRRTWPLFVGNLVAYGITLGVTVLVFNAGLAPSEPWLWVGLWASSASIALLFWISAVVPREALVLLRGPGLRALASGFFIGVVALLAGYGTAMFWEPMSRLTLELVAFGLRLSGQEVVSRPDELVVGTPAYNVFVDRPCSGYEGIGLITVLLGFYLFYSRKSLRFPNALLLFPTGVILVWCANSVRIWALICVGTWVSPQVAEGGFHSAAGWLLFCLITLGLIAASERSAWFSTGQTRRTGSFRTPEGAFLLPLLVLLATQLASTLFSEGFDYLYPLWVLTPLIPLWLFRDYYTDLRWSWSWTPIGLGGLVFVLWIAFEPAHGPEVTATIPNAMAQMHWAAATLWLFVRIVGSSLMVPIVEELAFRGYLLRRLISSDFTAVSPRQFTLSSFLISSVVFGALHQRWLAGILAGMVYAVAQNRRGRLTDAITAHAVTNFLVAAYVLLFARWEFW